MSPAPVDPTTPAVGATAIEVVLHAANVHPEIEQFEFLRLQMPPSVEGRPGATSRMRAYTDQVRAMQHEGDSFTETFMAVAEKHGDLESALDVVSFHQPLSDAIATYTISRRELSRAFLDELVDATRSNEMLVLTSRCLTDSGDAHLPMLDFKMASSEANLPVARAVARRQGGGALLDSGSSYHLYGDKLLSSDQLSRWLLRAQLLSRCVDTRWVTHQLLERKAALRLTRGGGRYAVPRVVEWVDPVSGAT